MMREGQFIGNRFQRIGIIAHQDLGAHPLGDGVHPLREGLSILCSDLINAQGQSGERID
jgi:hypothetical protein